MANKQIHQLTAEITPSTADLLMLSKADNQNARSISVADLPLRTDLANSVNRKLGDKALESVSVKDFGATGEGIVDESAAFAMALGASASTILIPAGRYRLTSPLLLPSNKRLLGGGKHSTALVSEHAGNLLTLSADAAGMCRSSIEGLSLSVSSNGDGLRVEGQDIILRDLQFSGSKRDGWGIDLINCRGAQLQNISMGGPARDFYANGLRWRDSTPEDISNFGESTVIGIDIRLGSANTTAIHMAGDSGGLINNMFIAHARIQAPATDGTPLDGTVAVRLDSTVRTSLIGLSLEALATGIVEIGISNALGACVANQYIGVSAINVTTAYQDSNAVIGRSVQQRTFAGCDNFPATSGLNDGDAIMPAGLWLQSFVNGDNAVRMRCFTGHELIIDDGAEIGALSLDVGGSNPRVAPKDYDPGRRLYIGRGSSSANNTMRDVTIEPVLRLAPRDSENPGTTTGQVVYADGTNWDPGKGEGFYAFERGAWRKLAFED